MDLKNRFQQMTPGTQLFIVGLGIFVGYKVFKKLFPGPNDSKSGGTSPGGVTVQEENLTYSDSDYHLFSDQLESAFWSSPWFEYDQDVAQILSLMATDDDVYKLIATYGVRGRGVIIKEEYNLPQTVQMYLDESLVASVNNLYETRNMSVRWT